jgi:hypothetical protein
MNWRYLFRREKWNRERLEEIESYVQMETDQNVARGMRDAEARAAACRKLGNSTRIQGAFHELSEGKSFARCEVHCHRYRFYGVCHSFIVRLN